MTDCCAGDDKHLGLCLIQLQGRTAEFREGFFAAVAECETRNRVSAALQGEFPSEGYRNGFRVAAEFLSCAASVGIIECDAKDRGWIVVEAPCDGNATYIINGNGAVEFDRIGLEL